MWGWVKTFSRDDFTDEGNYAATADPIEINVVFAAYIEGKAEDDSDSDSDDEDENSNEDGATAVTTFAATLVAGFYALTF